MAVRIKGAFFGNDFDTAIFQELHQFFLDLTQPVEPGAALLFYLCRYILKGQIKIVNGRQQAMDDLGACAINFIGLLLFLTAAAVVKFGGSAL